MCFQVSAIEYANFYISMALLTLLTDFDNWMDDFACNGSHDDGMFRGCEEHDFTENQLVWMGKLYVRLVMQIVENTCNLLKLIRISNLNFKTKQIVKLIEKKIIIWELKEIMSGLSNKT